MQKPTTTTTLLCVRRALILICWLGLIMINNTQGFYLKLEEGQQKCFVEEVPKDTLILSKWKSEDQKGSTETIASKNLGIIIVVRDPLEQQIYLKTLGANSRFAFTSQVGGEYTICFQSNTSISWFNKLKYNFHVEITTGSSAKDWQEVAKKEHLTSFEVKLRMLYADVEFLRSEQSYHRIREEAFRDTSESTNSRVVWWSVFQISVVCIVALWQMRHLKQFFKKKKLV